MCPCDEIDGKYKEIASRAVQCPTMELPTSYFVDDHVHDTS